jgi:hypothetical protein
MRSAAIAAVLAAMFPTVDVGAVTLKPANGVVVTTGPAPQLTVVATNQLVDTADGAGLATGIVKNTGTGNVSNIEVDLAFYDSNNNVVESDDENTIVFADLDELAPGEQTGFTTIFALPAGYDHFGVTSVTGDDDPTPPNHNFTVAVTNTADDGLGGTSVTGTVKNNNAVTADDVDVTFIFLDAAGKPLFTDYAWPDTADGSLAAGASATFEEDAPSYSSVIMVAEADPAGATQPPPATVTCSPCVPFTRVAGATRVGTSVAASQDQFTAGAASAVVLARDDQFPDALAGGPLAAHVHGPLLLTAPTSLDPAARAEIQRVAPVGSSVYILGGQAAVSTSVDAALTALGYDPIRVYGANRFATAVAVAKAMGNPTTVFEATGLNFPDALSGGPAAVAKGAAIVLTNGDKPAPETTQYLASISSTARYALGGPAAAADPGATPLVGADRFATSALIASMFFAAPQTVGIATGANFPDALGAGPDLGGKQAPLLLVPSGTTLSTSLGGYLFEAGASVTAGEVFGGTSAVSAATVSAVQNTLFLGSF